MKLRPTSILSIASLGLVFTSVAAQTVQAPFPDTPARPGNVYTRMFPDLPAFAEQNDTVRKSLRSLAPPGGILDAQDNLTDPIQSITNPAVFSPRNPDNPDMTAGVTFLGQFLDHDMTFDKNSKLNQDALPEQTENFRTSALDLDTVYGKGPEGSPELYETQDRLIKFRVQAISGSEHASKDQTIRYDIPRDASGAAVMGDSRNDENVIVSQMHLALLSFHNAVTDYLAEEPAYKNDAPMELFKTARRIVTWHYQWIIVHQFLPTIIGQDRVDDILDEGLKYYKPGGPQKHSREREGQDMPLIPVEFSIAAYRFGHSQVRPSYRLNFGSRSGTPFFAFLFDENLDPNAADPDDLRGGKRAPRRFVDWQTFFDFGDGNVRPNKRIDTKLSSVLLALPGSRGPAPGLPPDGVQSLPERTFTRHVDFGLPSGQAIAQKMHAAVLEPWQLREIAHLGVDTRHTMDTSTPLFYYVLKEAEVMESGLRLGPVGSRVVGEVFIGLLKSDPASYLRAMPEWQPILPGTTPGKFTITDLLNFAGVVHPV